MLNWNYKIRLHFRSMFWTVFDLADHSRCVYMKTNLGDVYIDSNIDKSRLKRLQNNTRSSKIINIFKRRRNLFNCDRIKNNGKTRSISLREKSFIIPLGIGLSLCAMNQNECRLANFSTYLPLHDQKARIIWYWASCLSVWVESITRFRGPSQTKWYVMYVTVCMCLFAAGDM